MAAAPAGRFSSIAVFLGSLASLPLATFIYNVGRDHVAREDAASRDARAKRSLQATTTLSLVNEWGTTDMQDAIDGVIRYCHKNGGLKGNCAQTWAKQKQDGDAEALVVDKYRRKWVFTWNKWMVLQHGDLLLEEVLKDFPGKSRAEVFLQYAEPFEKANCEVILQRKWNADTQPAAFSFARKHYNIL